jgi:hypothetical protein
MTEGLEFEFRHGQEFSLHHIVHTDSGAHPASYAMGNGVLSLGAKRTRREPDHTYPTNLEVKRKSIYKSTPQYVFMP